MENAERKIVMFRRETTLIPRIKECKTTPGIITEKAEITSKAVKRSIVNQTPGFLRKFLSEFSSRLILACNKKEFGVEIRIQS